MKKYTKTFTILFLALFLLLVGCNNKPDEPKESFYYLEICDSVTLDSETVTFTKSPIKASFVKEANYDNPDFIGYAYDIDGKEIIDKDDDIDLSTFKTIYSIWKEIIPETNPFIIDDIGEIRLNVTNDITSKEDYENGTIKISGESYNLDETNIRIRLRGNSSLSAPKKSYKIKFDSKQDLFGFGKDKEWALIANYYDSSLLRNYYAYKFAIAMGIPYSVDCKLVEVYLNDVDQGLYLLTETVKTGSDRVNIEVDYTAEDVEIPFLLELDMKMTEDSDPLSNGTLDKDYFIVDIPHYKFANYPIATKYPDSFTTEDITEAQYNYIKDYVNNAYKSLKNGNYEEYYEVDSVINYFLLQELFMNIDQDYSSVFFYKPVDGKINYGPVWDFDISIGNANYYDSYGPEMKMKDVNTGSYTFYTLMDYPKFRTAFMNRLSEIEPIVNKMLDSISLNYNIVKDYAKNDDKIWNTLNRSFWPKPANLVGITYYEQLSYIKDYIETHYEYMIENY